MKRILLLAVMAVLILGTASAILGSEATIRPQAYTEPELPLAPWERTLCVSILNSATPDTSGVHALYAAYPTGTDTTYTFSAAEVAAFAVESAKAPGGRSLVIQTCDIDGSNNNDIKASAITVTGTNAKGATITSVFTPTDNTAGAATETSVTAFKTISTIKIVKMDGAGARVSVGFGYYFGLPFTSPENTVLTATCSGVRETTFPTVVYSGTDLELNAVKFNTDPNGTRDFRVHLIWPCYASASADTKWAR